MSNCQENSYETAKPPYSRKINRFYRQVCYGIMFETQGLSISAFIQRISVVCFIVILLIKLLLPYSLSIFCLLLVQFVLRLTMWQYTEFLLQKMY